MSNETRNKETARAFTNALNSFGVDYKGIAQAMLSEHRTLQQNFTKLCVEWLKAIGSCEEWFVDGRNEASHELAKKLLPLLEEKYLPSI